MNGTSLEALTVELRKANGQFAKWESLCRVQNATAIEWQVQIAEQVLAERAHGSVRESYYKYLKAKGVPAVPIKHTYKPTGF